MSLRRSAATAAISILTLQKLSAGKTPAFFPVFSRRPGSCKSQFLTRQVRDLLCAEHFVIDPNIINQA